jgi:transposase
VTIKGVRLGNDFEILQTKVMKLIHVIGADISKKSIDLFCYGLNSHLKIDNDVMGFKKLLVWLSKSSLCIKNLVIVLEHTGYYSYHFENFLHQHQIGFSKVSALAIKKSLGLVRGKNDKIDAQRIARFGYEKRDRLRLEMPADPVLMRLQVLMASRNLLIKQRSAVTCTIKEYRVILTESDPIIKRHLSVKSELSSQIKSVEKEMEGLLHKPGPIAASFRLLTSIKGIGLIVATATLIKTKNFTSFPNRKKFACFCGSAPFEHTSGTSIKKRTRISHLADKSMKTLLTQSAKTAIQHDKELKQYYERRTRMGKSKRSTINVVRNKLIHRMFAVIKRQTPYIEQYPKRA